MVRALLFTPDISDVQKAADLLHQMCDANKEAIKDSFRQEKFVTTKGLDGLHVYYIQRSAKDGESIETHSHNYVVMNREARCVSISYIATVANDSDAVHQMVTKTLELHE